MNRRQTLGLMAVGAVALGYGAIALQSNAHQSETAKIGKPFKNITLRNMSDAKGKMVSLSSFKGKKVVVGIIMQQNCGTTWAYEKKMGQLLSAYKGKDVEVFAIHPAFNETDEEIKGMLEQRNLPLPVLDDKPKTELLKYLGANCSPTFFVIDKKGNLAYRGSYDARPSETKVSFVRNAVDALLANKPVPLAETRAFG
jgi:peroxiredoxin